METSSQGTQSATAGPDGAASTVSSGSDSSAPPVQKYKVKPDGKEMEVSIEDLTKSYELKSAADARMREAAEIRKRHEALESQYRQLTEYLQGSKSDPTRLFELAEQLGVDLFPHMEERVLDRMKYDLMDDDQKKYYDAEKKLREYEKKEKKEREAAERQKQQNELAQAQKAVEDSFVSFLEANKGKFDPDPALTGRALDHMIYAVTNGQQLSVEGAFSEAQKWFERERQGIHERYLKKLIAQGNAPKELVEMFRKQDLSTIKKEIPKRNSNPSEPPRGPSGKTTEDFFSEMDKRYKIKRK